MKDKRRVKFFERDTFHPATDQQTISSPSTDGRHASSRASPKTFEYKYFMRLLDEAGNGSHSRHLVRRGNRLSSSFKEEKRNVHIHKNETNVQKLQAEKPANEEVPLLPTGRLSEKEVMREVLQLGAYKEPQTVNGGTFFEKRQNLIKRAASVLSLEEHEATSKGRALIPVLLDRLGINRKPENCDELQKTNGVDPNMEYPRVNYPEGKIFLDKPYEALETVYMPSPARDFTEDDLAGGWWKSASEISPLIGNEEEQFSPIWSTAASDFPKRQRHSYFLMGAPNPLPQNRLEFDFSRSVEASTSRYTEHVFDHETFTSSDLEHHEEASALSQRNLHVPLLSWGGINNEGELSPASESPGKKQEYKWALTQSKDMIYPCLNPSSSPSRPEFSQGSQWVDFLSSDSCRDSLSSFTRPFRSSSSNLLLGSVDSGAGALAKKWSFYQEAMDVGDEDGDGPSLVNWIDADDAWPFDS